MISHDFFFWFTPDASNRVFFVVSRKVFGAFSSQPQVRLAKHNLTAPSRIKALRPKALSCPENTGSHAAAHQLNHPILGMISFHARPPDTEDEVIFFVVVLFKSVAGAA